MIVFEHLHDKSLKLSVVQDQAVNLISKQEQLDEEKRTRHTSSGLDSIIGKQPLECHMLFDVVVIGLFTTYGCDKEKVQKILEELHRAFSELL